MKIERVFNDIIKHMYVCLIVYGMSNKNIVIENSQQNRTHADKKSKVFFYQQK